MQGRDVRRPPVGARRAYYDCDIDALLFVVEQEGRGACHTGERSCFFRAFGSGAAPGPVCDAARGRRRRVRRARRATTRSCRSGARCWPTSRRRSRRSSSSSATRRGLPARVGRARRALGPVLVPRPRPRAHARGCAVSRSRSPVARPPPGRAARPGRLAALEALLAWYRAPTHPRAAAVPRRRRRLPRLRRRARDRAPARRPARRPGLSRRGALAHRPRHRVRPLPPAPLPHRERVPRARRERRRRRRRRTTMREPGSTRASTSSPGRCPYVPVAAGAASRSTELPSFTLDDARRPVPRRGRGGA